MYKPWAKATGTIEDRDSVDTRTQDAPEALFWAPQTSLTSRMQSLMHSIIDASTHGGDDNDNDSPSPFAGTQDSQESQKSSITVRKRKKRRWSLFKGTSGVSYASEDQVDEIAGHIAELESHIGAAEQHLDDLEDHASPGEIEIIETMRAEIRDIRGWVDAHHGKFSKNEKISIGDFEEAVGKIERRVARMEAMHFRLAEFSSVLNSKPEPELAYE